MNDTVKIVECPRDAWQGLPQQIPAHAKAVYLRKLIESGFTHIDAVSFVSPAAVPQMADSEQVLSLLGSHAGVEIIAIVVNERGAQRAIDTRAVQTLGFPYSISSQFLRRNQNQTQRQSLAVMQSIAAMGLKTGLEVVGYISMAFGNPYGDAWSIDEVKAACCRLIDSGIRQISLADTVGLATPAQIEEVLAAVLAIQAEAEVGVHLHARTSEASGKIRAAWLAGCRRFDSAIGGLGGCPFAQDDLVGNIPTETLIATLENLGAQLEPITSLGDLHQSAQEIANKFTIAVSQQ